MKKLISKVAYHRLFIKKWIKAEILFCVTFSLAVATTIVFSFDTKKLIGAVSFIDFRLLSLMLCLMLIMQGFIKIGVFNVLSQKILSKIQTTRLLSITLILICFFTATFFTNSVALISFIPFTILVYSAVGWKQKLVYVVALETIAANLGGMLTPIGNSQNLFLFSNFDITLASFLLITVPLGVLGLAVVILVCCVLPSRNLKLNFPQKQVISSKLKLAIYSGMFLTFILVVLRVLPWQYIALIIVGYFLVLETKSMLTVDWFLIFTIACFFIISYNLQQSQVLQVFLKTVVLDNEFIISVILSQFISNMPTAILISSFTDNIKAVLIATNIASFGTLVASLGNLVAYKLFAKSQPSGALKYLKIFSILNGVMFVILLFFSKSML